MPSAACDHAADMSPARSALLPVALVPVVVLLGVLAMGVVLPVAAPFGLRPALILAELALCAPAVLALALWRVAPGAGLGLRPLAARELALAAFSGAALWLASLGLMEIQAWLRPPPPGFIELFQRLHAMLRPKDALDALLSLAAIALAPAVCEELVFRGAALPSLARALGPASGVFASAFLFGFIHVDAVGGALSLYRVPFALSVGVGLGLLRLRKGGLGLAVAAHATLNAITFAAVPFTEPITGNTLPESNPLIGAVMLGVGVGLFALALRGLPRTTADSGTLSS